MSRLSVVFCVLLVALCLHMAASVDVSCDGFLCVMKTEKSYFEIDNHGARLHLIDREGNPRKEFSSMGIGFSHLAERRKNITNPATQSAVCLSASQDPALNYDEEKERWLGELVQLYTIADLVTYTQILEDTPVPGITTVKFTSYDGPSPILAVTYSLSSIWYNETFASPNIYTNWTTPVATYRPDNLKISLEIPEFRWMSPSTGQNYSESFGLVYLNLTYKYTEGDILSAGKDDQIYVTVVNEQHGYGMKYGLDLYYAIDNVGFLSRAGEAPNQEITNVSGILLPAQSFSDLPVCKEQYGSPFGHWQKLEYDPSIGVLFSSFPEPPAQGPENSAAKSKKSAMIGVYIAVPLVVVLLGGFVLLTLFVPAIYNKVLPSDPFKRNQSSKAKPVVADVVADVVAKPAVAGPPPGATPSPSPSPAPSNPGSWKAVQKPLLP